VISNAYCLKGKSENISKSNFWVMTRGIIIMDIQSLLSQPKVVKVGPNI